MTPPYSRVRRGHGFLFVSGQLGWFEDGSFAQGIGQQTTLALRNLEAALAEHHATLDDVVKCGVYLTSVSDWAAMNEAYAQVFTPPYPARTAIGAELIPGALVEVDAVAVALAPGA